LTPSPFFPERTAEVVAIFGKNYVSALVQSKIKQIVDGAIKTALDEVKAAVPQANSAEEKVGGRF
jgi:hypothetical protein